MKCEVKNIRDTGNLWLNEWGIYDIMDGAFMT